MPTLDPNDIYQLCLSVGFSPDESVTMTAIAMAESGGNTEAHNGHGEDSWGLWQVNVGAGANHNQWGDLTDPLNNARAAFDISHGGSSISPWTTTHDSNAGTAHDYRNFMDEARAASGGQYMGYDQGVAGYGSGLRGAGMPGDGEAVPGAGHVPDIAGADPLHAPPDADPGHSAGVEAFLAAATAQQGDSYVFGAEADVHDVDPDVFDCCLAAGSLVVTDRGAVPIEEVEAGDVVVSWNGGSAERRKVVGVLDQGEQRVFRLRTRNRTVVATANHPFLVLRRADRQRLGVPVEWRTEWTRLDQLARGDLIVTLDHLDSDGEEVALADGTPVTPDVAWLLGLLVGDGTVGRDQVRVCVFGDVRERARAIVHDVWGLAADDHPTAGLLVRRSTALSRVLADALGIHAASDERVPSLVWRLPAAQRRSYLDGYLAADSHVDARGYLAYRSASRRLVAETRMLHVLLGDDVSNLTTTKRSKPITTEGGVVGDALPLHSFRVRPGSGRRAQTVLDTYGARRAVPDRRFSVERILGIHDAGVESTWDIEVEGAHNFVADGVVVHNSELVQWAAGQVGIDLPDGSWVQYLQLQQQGATISVDQALHTPGAILFSFSSEPTPGGGRPSHAHVAISLGDGRTIEARGTQYGVGEFEAGHRFQYAAVLPGLDDVVVPGADAAAPTVVVDTDHDGISDYDELSLGLDPNVGDSDHDGLLDGFEQALGLNPLSPDSDNDGLSDSYELSRSHTNPLAADTDSDGVNDNMELLAGTDAVQGVHFQLGDGAAAAGYGLGTEPDTDLDGLSDAREAQLGTNANDVDSDHDGVKDSVEYAAGTNLLSADSDGDGLSDSFELSLGTDPLSADTDHDGIFDGAEFASGGDPLVSALATPAPVAPAAPAIPVYEPVVGAGPSLPSSPVGIPPLGADTALDPLHHATAPDHHADDDDGDDDGPDDFDDIVGP